MQPKTTAVRTLWALIGVEGLSFLGSEVARFGVSIWIYRATGSVNAFAMLVFANSVPGLLFAPLAGSIADRRSRKGVMVGAALVAMCGTLIVLWGAAFGHLSMAVVIAGACLASIGEAFQWPALAATVPLLATEADLPRFNGLVESVRALSQLAGPVLGGVLFALLRLPGLLAVEVVTFLMAMAAVSCLRIPSPTPGPASAGATPGVLTDSLFGLKWIWVHRPMLLFLGVAVFGNIFLNIGLVLMAPYGLGLLGEREYGVASGLFGAGMIAGGLVFGPLAKRLTNIHIVLGTAVVMGLLYVVYGLARSFWALATINFALAMLMTAANAGILTIWQRQVAEDQAGRVLSAVRMVAYGSGPVCYLLAGPLAERAVPWLLGGGGWPAAAARRLWGPGSTGQIGFLFSAMGALMFMGMVLATLVPTVRNVERT